MVFAKLSARAKWTIESLACVILVLSLAGQAGAAKHPVPLDPKADSAICLSCHEDKTKGKSVHSAIAMGCLSCHTKFGSTGISHM
jgi:hypothetical protein